MLPQQLHHLNLEMQVICDEKIMKMVYKTGAVMTGVDASGNGWGQYVSNISSSPYKFI